MDTKQPTKRSNRDADISCAFVLVESKAARSVGRGF